VLFGVGLIAGWVALGSAGIIVTAEEAFTRRASTRSERSGEAAFGRRAYE
jgi:hypothetical protein